MSTCELVDGSFVVPRARLDQSRRRTATAECPGRGGAERRILVQFGPEAATIGPVIRVELERVEVLQLLGMTLAHLNDAEARAEMSPRVPLLMAVRDKLAFTLREKYELLSS